MDVEQTLANATTSVTAAAFAAVDPGRKPLLSDLNFLANTVVVQYADRWFGQYADYGLALAFAIAFPTLRYLLDMLLYKVGVPIHMSELWR